MKSKLFVAAVAAFLLSPLALANGYMPQPVTSPFDGPYLGLGAGVVHNVADAKANYAWEHQELFTNNSVPPTITGNIDASTDKGMNTIGGTAFAGWGHTFGANKTWYLAGELYVRYSPSNGKYSSYTHSETYTNAPYWENVGHSFKYGKLRTDWFYGIQAKGGYVICPHTVFYLSFGAETTRFHVSRTEHGFWENANYPGYTPGPPHEN